MSEPRWRATVLLTAFFVVAWGLLFAVYQTHPLLYDADSYYHLAVARAFAEHGTLRALPWARFSVLHDQLGDNSLAFHWLLAPFAARGEAGGRLALAALGAGIFTALAALARRAVGTWGLAVPLGLVYTCPEFVWRVVRLRPELLSLALLLALLAAVGAGRDRLGGAIALVYTLSYTAFEALLGLALGLFLFFGLVRRRWRWTLALYPLLGCGAGLLLHPQFPANLRVWALHWSVLAQADLSDSGSELLANPSAEIVRQNLAWFLAVAVLGLAATRREDPRDADWADTFGLAALAFAGLYLLYSRFSLYAYPLATLAFLFELRRRGRRIGPFLELGALRVPTAAALAAVVLVAWPAAHRNAETYAQRTTPGPHGERSLDRQRLAAAIPAGAKVLAPWRSTPVYMYFAPQAAYVNVLDPLGMIAKDPAAYEAQRAVFAGVEPDVPRTAVARLDSDYIAFSLASESPLLRRRLENDPRVVPLYRGIQALYRVLPDRNRDFVLDWRRAPDGAPPPRAAAEVASWSDASPTGPARRYAGFVEAGGGGCAMFASPLAGPGGTLSLELAPYGPAELFLDGERQVALGGDPRAVLGEGVRLDLHPAPGAHLLAVRTCPSQEPARTGFYLLRRPPS